MADKLLFDVTKFGTIQDNELGIEVDDSRGRQGDKTITRLFPVTGGGGGQSSQIVLVNRYRPGNRYKYVRLNGTVTQYNAVKRDVSFATEADRDSNFINTSAVNNVLGGVVEFGSGGPLTTDPALTSHAAGVFGFVTTRGKAICNTTTADAADAQLGTSATAGRLSTITIATPTAAEVQRVLAAASGLGAHLMVTVPATGFKANLSWIVLT